MPSKLIGAFDYDPQKSWLDISFVTGRRYRYFAVPAEIFDRMRNSFSKGAFFNRHIRGHFAYRELPAPPRAPAGR